jgi:thiazole synthase ThiGH ThiG subunit
MQPRINRKTENGQLVKIADDEIVVSPERFETMKKRATLVDGDYYVMTYRNPVPNGENITMNKVLPDYSMVSMEDAAISPWNAFINKQADYDGDHLNITYINNPLYTGKQL